MLDMTRKQILPAVWGFSAKLAEGLNTKRRLNLGLATHAEEELLRRICTLSDTLAAGADTLETLIPDTASCTAENAARELQELRMQLERSRMECDRLRREVGYMRGQDM